MRGHVKGHRIGSSANPWAGRKSGKFVMAMDIWASLPWIYTVPRGASRPVAGAGPAEETPEWQNSLL